MHENEAPTAQAQFEPLGKGPWRVNVWGTEGVYDANGELIGLSAIPAIDGSYDRNAIARLFASSWSFYKAAKLRAQYKAMPIDRGGPDGPKGKALDAWLAMEAQALAIAEGRPLPVPMPHSFEPPPVTQEMGA